jgi:ribosome assembly protein YihI (activator of Der GTPase)
LRTNRKEVEKKRLEVEKSIKNLRKRTELINRRLKPLDVWKSIEAHNLSWVASTADRCQQEAHNSVANISENEQGYMNMQSQKYLSTLANSC